MSRLIDASALEARMYHDAFEVGSDMQKWDSGCWIRYKMFEDAIKEAPTIERKTGKWIRTYTQAGYDINGDLVWADMMKCETCGFEICAIQGHIAQYNYCPNCGADMRGEGHE